MNHVCGLKQMLEEKYQISQYILSTAQNDTMHLALDRKDCQPWEKLDKYFDVLRMASYPLSFSKWFRHTSRFSILKNKKLSPLPSMRPQQS